MHAACRYVKESLYTGGMQKSMYGHVKNEKIVLGRTGSPTGLGHLQLQTFRHFNFSLL
jgi:hypothetical protein